ncbi:peptidase S26B, signal peptidase [Haloterrigena turkmenica DSM 5511]|uniref:Peptidase S26B, signal peptidase n=1 Tax=Haloterrigena turkmenica (strain ATCC 51198 / DSM 5511 / JCM 9101 / NCIMB 13204 / VKM B-1734 / 4k) TaxID=543526 RepID=D2RQJ4_HALTV|nr:signal peptidase I [Haloterrigena turkmenica]ADB62371.1 peptidase S26B, signal peptidase [Haloterrigena turkmenica DSM 5511]
MTGTTLLKRTLGLGVALVVVLLLVGQLLGQPILLGYVATGSMEPAMDAGDGFVAVPSLVDSSVEQGDVVVFEARELHGGGLTTHRVVGETEEGYVTKGDANPFTDQDSGEPHVTDGQIVAKAWQVNGEVVTIPLLGTAIMGVQGVVESAYESVAPVVGLTTTGDSEGLGAALVAVGVALLGFGTVFERLGPARREIHRSRSRENVIAFWTALGLVLLVFVTFATAAMVVPAGTTEYELVSTDSPTDDPQVIAPGETTELTRTVDNAGYLPIVAVHEPGSNNVAIDPPTQTVGIRSSGETTVSLTAPDETGSYTRHVGEYRYLAVLPPAAIVWLHGLHPLAAIAAVNGVIVGLAVAIVLVVFGHNDLRVRSAGDHIPVSTRLERKLRKWLRE